MNYFRNDLYRDFSILPTLIQNHELLIDLRPHDIFLNYSLPGFINIPASLFYQYLPSLDRKKTLYLLCQHGKVSKEIATNLQSMGYLAYSFIGGIDYYLQHIDSTLF